MKTTLHYLSLNAQATWHRQVEEQLQHLHSLTPITAAEVVLEHQRETRPAFRVQVRLVVPGPGAHLKATRDLEHQIQARQVRRLERGKSKLQLSAVSGRWSHTHAGRRACGKSAK